MLSDSFPEPYELNKTAAGHCMKGVAFRMGKTYETVRKQCNPPKEDSFGRESVDYYGQFLQFWYAIKAENPEGGSLYVQDLTARDAAEEFSAELSEESWCNAIGDVAKETAETINVAVKNKSVTEIVVEASQAIARLQNLIALAYRLNGVDKAMPEPVRRFDERKRAV